MVRDIILHNFIQLVIYVPVIVDHVEIQFASLLLLHSENVLTLVRVEVFVLLEVSILID